MSWQSIFKNGVFTVSVTDNFDCNSYKYGTTSRLEGPQVVFFIWPSFSRNAFGAFEGPGRFQNQFGEEGASHFSSYKTDLLFPFQIANAAFAIPSSKFRPGYSLRGDTDSSTLQIEHMLSVEDWSVILVVIVDSSEF